MVRMRPANISDFFAPTGGAAKIADFKASTSLPMVPETTLIASGTYQIECKPNMAGEAGVPSKSIKWEHWVIGGMLVLGTSVFLVWYFSEEQKKKRQDKARNW